MKCSGQNCDEFVEKRGYCKRCWREYRKKNTKSSQHEVIKNFIERMDEELQKLADVYRIKR